jgi:hypothetical protein
MVDLFPRCVKCSCHVTDSIEPEVEKGAHLKLGRYVDSDCFRQTEGLEIASG